MNRVRAGADEDSSAASLAAHNDDVVQDTVARDDDDDEKEEAEEREEHEHRAKRRHKDEDEEAEGREAHEHGEGKEEEREEEEHERLFRFSKADLGKTPKGWTVAKTGQGEGSQWKVAADPTAPSGTGHVLAQTAKSPGRVFNLCVVDDSKYRDVEIEVCFKAVHGKASGRK